VYKWSVEREKEDPDRDQGYQERDIDRAIRTLKDTQINLVLTHDKKVLKYFVTQILNLPNDRRVVAIDQYFGRNATDTEIQAKLDAMYAATKIGDLDARMAMFEKSKKQLEELDDPLVNLAIALRPELDQAQEEDEAFDGALKRLEPKLAMAHAEWKQGDIYPDANGTLRFNYGQVKGYSPADGVDYRYYTTLKGIFEKETGVDPFIIPDELKEIYNRKDFGAYYDSSIGGVPVNFVTDNSGTNGSSGSAVINGKGELIGIDFDTDYEGVSADYIYNPDVCRAVIVDLKYVLFLIDQVYHLDKLMSELTIH
jgi:hypothetical protein